MHCLSESAPSEIGLFVPVGAVLELVHVARIYSSKTLATQSPVRQENGTMSDAQGSIPLHTVPQVMLAVRQGLNGRQELNKMKNVSRAFAAAGRATTELYDARRNTFTLEMPNLVESHHKRSIQTLVSMHRDFLHDGHIQGALLACIKKIICALNGAKWVCVHDEQLQTHHIDDPALALALGNNQLSFLREQWDTFKVANVGQHACITTAGKMFRPDVAAINAHGIIDPDVLHDIILRIMHTNSRERELVFDCCFVLKCLHTSPYKERLRADDYEHTAIRAMKLLVATLHHFADDGLMQIEAGEASVSICKNMRPCATQTLLQHGCSDVMVPIFAATHKFSHCYEVMLVALEFIMIDGMIDYAADSVQHQLHIASRAPLYSGVNAYLEMLSHQTSDEFVTCLWRAIETVIRTRFASLHGRYWFLEFLVFCLQTYHDTNATHANRRHAAISATLCLMRACQSQNWCARTKFQHRESIQTQILALGVPVSQEIATDLERQHDSVITRVLGYCCVYTTVRVIRSALPQLCCLLDFVAELCKDNNEARLTFLLEANGINTCMTLARDFSASGNMLVVQHAIDVLRAVYVQDSPQAPKISAQVLKTAGCNDDAVYKLGSILFLRHTICVPLDGHMTVPVPHTPGVTVLSFLLDLMVHPLASWQLVETSLAIVANCCKIARNTTHVNEAIITAAVAPFAATIDALSASRIHALTGKIARRCHRARRGTATNSTTLSSVPAYVI